jgi:CheY-like chemotaxis protein
MLINLVEHNARETLLSLIQDINRVQTSVWGLIFIKRRFLKAVSNEELMHTLKPALADVTEAKLFVLENSDAYIAWRGMQKRVQTQITDIITKQLLREPDRANSSAIYFDPLVMGNEISTLLRAQQKETPPMATKPSNDVMPVKGVPTPETQQMRKFQEALSRRADRKQLEVLVVEDQQLLRRLLHEVLRGDHLVNSVPGVRDGWNLYLERAPDVAFLDIGLNDGNGHDLARAIKQIDPESYVVMVTSNNTDDEIETARLNHADGFVAKPYCKQQIFDYIDRHVSARRLSAVQSRYL